MLSALAKVHAQARLPIGEGFEQLLHDAASSHNTDLQLRAVQIQSMFECVFSCAALPCQIYKHISHALSSNIGHDAVRRVRRSRSSMICTGILLQLIVLHGLTYNMQMFAELP